MSTMNSKLFAFLSGFFAFIFIIFLVHFAGFLVKNPKTPIFSLQKEEQKIFFQNPQNYFFWFNKIWNPTSLEKNIFNKINSQTFVPNTKKFIALTFDDGPHRSFTNKLVEILKSKNARATFFMLGQNAERYPDIVKNVFENGNEIASHSYSHPAFSKLSDDEIILQINKTSDILENIVGVRPTLFRPPYGDFNDKIFEKVDMNFILWSVDSLDWKYRNVNSNFKNTVPYVQNGSIILFHDIHEESINSIPAIIDDLKVKWYEFITVSELYEIFYHNQMNIKNKKCYSMSRCN